MLTTIAVIAILISLLVPALGLVQKTAMKVKQKSQFNSIDIALEGFATDFGDYPDSSYNTLDDSGYCGAQKLAEAVVGYDGFGVHPRSGFRSDGMNDVDGDSTLERVYDVINGITGSLSGTILETGAENRAVRKGPYLELESANAVKISDLYAVGPGTLERDTFVLADMFGKVRHRTTQKKTGMPILYFKADVRGTAHESPYTGGPALRYVYDIQHNDQIYRAPPAFGGNKPHELADRLNEQIFYDRTTNPNYPGTAGDPPRPYRSESFILLSAGPDGLYGTADDVYNFDTE
jgi:type II secretory pathway pseudopilin PulG